MARPIERIERDLAALEEAIAAIAQQLQTAYTSYLTTLGQAVQQQLILAVYHLCTQGYAEKFLKLSLSQRQNLQQSIRKLGKQAGEQLLALVNTQDLESEEFQEQSQDDAEIISSLETTEIEEINQEEEQKQQEQEEEYQEDTDISSFPLYSTFSSSLNPIELAKWQNYIEKSTQYILKKVSHEANLSLQKANILPRKLPEPILEEAIGSEGSAEMVPSPPNLMSLVIEIEHGQQLEEPSLTKIMAINLRLIEIEFADPKLSSERKQIRIILSQFNKLGQEYQKKQRERSIAEAEAAWRASWFED